MSKKTITILIIAILVLVVTSFLWFAQSDDEAKVVQKFTQTEIVPPTPISKKNSAQNEVAKVDEGITQTEIDTSSWKTYTNAEYRFSLRYPEGWEIEEKIGSLPFAPINCALSNLSVEAQKHCNYNIIILKTTNKNLEEKSIQFTVLEEGIADYVIDNATKKYTKQQMYYTLNGFNDLFGGCTLNAYIPSGERGHVYVNYNFSLGENPKNERDAICNNIIKSDTDIRGIISNVFVL